MNFRRSLLVATLALLSSPLRAQELSLSEAMRLAETRSVQMIVADQRVGQALERMGQSRSPLLPQLTASGFQNRKTANLESQGISLPGRDPMVGPFNSFDARVKLTQTLFDFGAMERLRQSRAGRDLSVVQKEKARQDATALVATLYVQARRAEAAKRYAETLVKRDQENLALARLRLNNGSGTSLEVAQAEAQQAASYRQRLAAESDAYERRLDLQAALGISPQETMTFPPSEPVTSPLPLSDEEVRRIVAGHDNVDVARATLDVRQMEQKSARADHFPRVSASADYGASGTTPAHAEGTYSYGAQFAIPIFEGGQKQARAAETRKAVEESRPQLDDVRLQTEARALSANQALQKFWAQVQTADQQLAVARQQKDLADTRWRTGSGSRFEQTQSEALLAASTDQREEVVSGYQIARINWARSLGRMNTLSERKP